MRAAILKAGRDKSSSWVSIRTQAGDSALLDGSGRIYSNSLVTKEEERSLWELWRCIFPTVII